MGSESTILPENRKLIKTVYMHAETEDLDGILTQVEEQIAALTEVYNEIAPLYNEAYAAAEKQIKSMSGEQYLDLLQKMLRSALKRQIEGEEESLRLYGEDIAPETYEVVLNSRDRDNYGEKLMTAFREGYGAKLPATALVKLRLAPDTAPIDGGLILRCGPVETNCSLSMLMAANRRETEAKVSRILFGDAN